MEARIRFYAEQLTQPKEHRDAAADVDVRPLGRQTFALVDLGAIRHNAAEMRRHLTASTKLAAVVKADAYGHGAVRAASAALDGGAGVLCVAMAEEAVPLRQTGIGCPILVIGPSNAAQLALGAALDLDLCVFSVGHIQALQREAERLGRAVRVHIKADTGMNRIGVRDKWELTQLLDTLAVSPGVKLAGMFTHYAAADTYGDQTDAQEQRKQFLQMAAAARVRGFRPLIHASNSAASQDLPESDLDMVRFGISLYGYAAGAGQAVRDLDLRSAMQIYAEISHIKDLRIGDRVGYGGTFTADRPMRVATVQIGYGDGYNRLLSNRGRMIVQTDVGPRFAPVVGRVCMDMTMIDVTGLRGVRTGDLVLAMGTLGTLRFDAGDMADILGTISYEVLLDYTSRVPRLYTDNQGAVPDRNPNRQGGHHG